MGCFPSMTMTDNVIEFPRADDVEPARPFVRGRSFCESWGLPPPAVATLIERELLYATVFTRRGRMFGGDIIAESFEQAQRVADERGLGEEVVGRLCGQLE